MKARLRAAAIIDTIDQLQARIGLRFPKSSLKTVCGELAAHARTVSERARRIGRPYLLLRA